MSEYLTRINHFTFESEGDQIVVTSEVDESFEHRTEWPDDLSPTDEDLYEQFHERFYTDLVTNVDG